MGKFLDLNEFRAQAAQAKRLLSFRSKFQNLRLNQRIDAHTQFISDPVWMACADPVDYQSAGRQALHCRFGSEPDHRHDQPSGLLAGRVAPCCPTSGCRLRACTIAIERKAAHYRAWRDAGLLETTPGKAINFKAIIRRLAEIQAQFDLQLVGYDRAFIKTFNMQCDEEGVRLPLKEYGQGYISMRPAVQLLEAAVLDRRIHHGGHPILRWQMSNVAIETDHSGNRKPSKKRAIAHIDGVVALLMAMGVAAQPMPTIDVRALIG